MYVVKGRQPAHPHMDRVLINDQVVGRLGMALGAPVGEPCLVEIPQALLDAEPEASHMAAGVAHATKLIPGCGGRMSYEHATETENRPRFARLAVLYGWMHAQDHQVIYLDDPPHTAYSVDHGHFFPSGPMWTPATLQQASPVLPDPQIMAQCGFAISDLREAGEALSVVTDVLIAEAIGIPPDAWGFTLADRVALAVYLSSRRMALLTTLGVAV